jgi:molybdate transport system substrate-binding protein
LALSQIQIPQAEACATLQQDKRHKPGTTEGKTEMQKYSMTVVVLACVFLFSQGVAGQTSEVRVLASNGIKAVVEDVIPQSEHVIGHKISVEYRPTAALQKEIEGGEPFDVVIVTAESIAQLSKEGKTTGGEGTPISRVGVGIGIRKGAPRPDISTPEALKRALLGAKAIAYGPSGASMPYIKRMLDTLGIADAMKAKTLLFDTSDGTNASVVQGKADLGITLISEILPVQGLELLGPFPDEFQGFVRFSAAVSANAKNPEAASALIKLLAGPEALPSIKARGMQAH